MRRIIGPSGIVVTVSDHVASGMVLAGHATYVDLEEEPTEPANETETGNVEDDEETGSETDPELVDDRTGDDEEYEVEEGSGELTEFDPSEHRVSEVLDHLENSSKEEQARVLALEADGKARQSILGND